MDDDLLRRSEAYLDGLFGAGAGRRHTEFLNRLPTDALRQTLHAYHVEEADTQHLSVQDNYLIGMCVLCATRSYGPASMFAKTLMHLGVPKERIFTAISRLAMWTGGVPAAEAAGHIQRAVREYEQIGQASLNVWFPQVTEDA
jgi:hypothetical protein